MRLRRSPRRLSAPMRITPYAAATKTNTVPAWTPSNADEAGDRNQCEQDRLDQRHGEQADAGVAMPRPVGDADPARLSVAAARHEATEAPEREEGRGPRRRSHRATATPAGLRASPFRSSQPSRATVPEEHELLPPDDPPAQHRPGQQRRDAGDTASERNAHREGRCGRSRRCRGRPR